jgi:hypothetical protein
MAGEQFPGQLSALDTTDLLTVAAISASFPDTFAAAALPSGIDEDGVEQELVRRVLSTSVQIRDRADAVALYIALTKAVRSLCALQPDPLDLVLGEPFLGPIVRLCRARTLVRGHFLGVLKRAAVG